MIDFTAKLFGLSKYEAAQKMTQDFGITEKNTDKPSVLTKLRDNLDHRNHTFRILTDYIKMLEEWRTVYKPSDTDDELKPQFLTALHELSRLQYYQDIFLSGTREEQNQIIKILQEDIPTFEKEIHRYRHHPFPGHKSADAALG